MNAGDTNRSSGENDTAKLPTGENDTRERERDEQNEEDGANHYAENLLPVSGYSQPFKHETERLS